MSRGMLAVVLLCVARSVSAAEYARHGTSVLSGGFAFARLTDSDSEVAQTQIALTPTLGYFVADGLEVDLIPSFTSNSVSGSGGSGASVTATLFGLGVGARYLFATDSNVYPFLGAQFGFLVGTTELESGDVLRSSKATGTRVGGIAGLDVTVGGSGVVSLGLGYAMTSLEPEGGGSDESQSGLHVSTALALFY